MKTVTCIEWNNALVKVGGTKFFNEKNTITLIVSKKMIANVIKLSGATGWEIEHIGNHNLSNRMRDCSKMTITRTLQGLFAILDKLNFPITTEGTHYYYRSELETNKNRPAMPSYWIFNKNSKRSYLASAVPFNMQGKKIARGNDRATAHFLAKKLF